jgi:DNA polymerase III subunit epsilon
MPSIADMLDSPLPWSAHSLVVLDCETTGPDPATAMPVELAAARFEGGELVGSWSTLLNPGAPIPPETTQIHGITDAMVADAPPVETAIALLLESGLLEGAYPCGYNGQHYDRTILRRLADAAFEPAEPISFETPPSSVHSWLACDWLDPLVYIRDIDGLVKGERGRHKLTAACERRGIVHERAHRAFGDCMATGKLLWALRERLGDMQLYELVRRTTVRGAAQQRDLDRYWGRGKVHGGRDVA